MSDSQAGKSNQSMVKLFFHASTVDFERVPGMPIAYWLSEGVRDAFSTFPPLREISIPRQGNTTTNNARFVRSWYEVAINSIGLCCSGAKEFNDNFFKWAPYNKGGGSRSWYGQNESVVNWKDNGAEIKAIPHSVIANESSYFSPGITWSTISTSGIGFRVFGNGFIFDNKGACIFVSGENQRKLAALLNSKVFERVLYQINPTVSLQPGDVAKFPIVSGLRIDEESALRNSDSCVLIARLDWDSYEVSWDFNSLPLLQADHHCQSTLNTCYQRLRAHWREITHEMQRLEEENNRIFIDAYGLQDELTPKVPLNEITLTCNPYYRYGADKTEEELEAMLLADTMRELVSYAVGCMLGRYSLDKPGLILANQGETLADYLAQVPQPSFPADDDNVIPVLDGDWFADDITLRFRQFLRVAFGEAHYEDNLAFIEQALNVKGKRNYSLRDYFLSEFYTDHVKRYKKRPIYWLFSSPKGSFNALIYMHRYRPDTVSVVLKYLRDYREKLTTEKERQASVSINPATSQGEKTKALKEVDRLAKVLTELNDYERDVLYPLATEQVQIDLDDGVKVNYLKFGTALKKIAGLDAKEED